MAGRSGVVGIGMLCLLVGSLGGCAPDDASVAESFAAATAEPSLPPEQEVSAIGTELWRLPLAVGATRNYAVNHLAGTFVLAALPEGAAMEVVIGDSRTGATSGEFALPIGSAWPILLGRPDRPTVVAAVPGPDSEYTDTVAAYDVQGTRLWQVTAAELGVPEGTGIYADASADDRLVVRAAPRPVTRYRDSPLWLLDGASGQVVWQPTEGQSARWAETAEGLLMYTWRSDGDVESASDRVTIRALTDGHELGTVEALNDFGGRASQLTKCGGIAAADRVAICRWNGAQHSVILADASGATLRTLETTNPPVIDKQTGVVAVDPRTESDGVVGVAASDGSELWKYSAIDAGQYGFDVDLGRDGLMLGSLVDRNLVMSSRSGRWLVAGNFDLIPSGASMGDVIVDLRDGFVIGHSAPGVGVGILQDRDDSLLFVTP